MLVSNSGREIFFAAQQKKLDAVQQDLYTAPQHELTLNKTEATFDSRLKPSLLQKDLVSFSHLGPLLSGGFFLPASQAASAICSNASELSKREEKRSAALWH